jgi:hypothetical protein
LYTNNESRLCCHCLDNFIDWGRRRRRQRRRGQCRRSDVWGQRISNVKSIVTNSEWEFFIHWKVRTMLIVVFLGLLLLLLLFKRGTLNKRFLTGFHNRWTFGMAGLARKLCFLKLIKNKVNLRAYTILR